jgi:hypothetical protein
MTGVANVEKRLERALAGAVGPTGRSRDTRCTFLPPLRSTWATDVAGRPHGDDLTATASTPHPISTHSPEGTTT